MPHSHEAIASRTLLWSRKGEEVRRIVVIGISAPHPIPPGSVSFEVHEGAASCVIMFDGLPQEDIVVQGADAIQALAFATDLDPYIRGLSRRYEFYFETGDPYFED